MPNVKTPSSNSFEDMLDSLPEILEVMQPRPYPSWGKLFVRSLGFPNSQDEAMYQIWGLYLK